MFFNIPGLLSTARNPRLDGRNLGGTETDITSQPYQVWPLRCCTVWRYFEISGQKIPPVFVTKISYSSKHIKTRYKNKAVAVCSSGGIVDWTEENWWFFSVICCFINCNVVSLHIGLLLRIVKQQTTEIHQFPAEGVTNYFQRTSFAGQGKHVDKNDGVSKVIT